MRDPTAPDVAALVAAGWIYSSAHAAWRDPASGRWLREAHALDLLAKDAARAAAKDNPRE